MTSCWAPVLGRNVLSVAVPHGNTIEAAANQVGKEITINSCGCSATVHTTVPRDTCARNEPQSTNTTPVCEPPQDPLRVPRGGAPLPAPCRRATRSRDLRAGAPPRPDQTGTTSEAHASRLPRRDRGPRAVRSPEAHRVITSRFVGACHAYHSGCTRRSAGPGRGDRGVDGGVATAAAEAAVAAGLLPLCGLCREVPDRAGARPPAASGHRRARWRIRSAPARTRRRPESQSRRREARQTEPAGHPPYGGAPTAAVAERQGEPPTDCRPPKGSWAAGRGRPGFSGPIAFRPSAEQPMSSQTALSHAASGAQAKSGTNRPRTSKRSLSGRARLWTSCA